MGEDLRQSNEHLHRNQHENELHHILRIWEQACEARAQRGERWHKMALETGRVRTGPAQRIMMTWIFGLPEMKACGLST